MRSSFFSPPLVYWLLLLYYLFVCFCVVVIVVVVRCKLAQGIMSGKYSQPVAAESSDKNVAPPTSTTPAASVGDGKKPSPPVS